MGEIGGAGTLPFTGEDILIVVKGFYLLGFMLYMVFSFVVVRQVEMMLKSLGGVLDLPIRMVAWIHLLLVIVMIGLVVVVL